MNVFLISHVADLDGVMPVILTDLAFPNYDYELLDIGEVDAFIQSKLETDFFSSYDKIFITDLGVSQKTASMIQELSYRDKFQILDHHVGNLFLNEYSFAEVVVERNHVLESGTSLYYKYLLTHYSNPNLLKNSVSYMVSLVRLLDTWEWKKYGVEEANDLGTIHSYYGNERFIQNYTQFLRKNREFYFVEAEKVLIEIDKKQREDYIEEQKQQMIIKEIAGYRVGIVFAEQYRSHVGNTLAEIFKDTVDLIMIVQINRSISFRSVKENVDVNHFASFFGGGGHFHAAGAPLPEDMKEVLIQDILSKMVEK